MAWFTEYSDMITGESFAAYSSTSIEYVDDMGNTLDVLDPLEGLEQNPPGGGLAASAGPDHHEAVVEVGDLIELDALVKPGGPLLPTLAAHELLLHADLGDLGLELVHGQPLVADPGEDVIEQREEQGDVLSHQLGLHGLAHRLDQNLLLGKVLSNLRLVNVRLPGLGHGLLDLVDPVPLDVAGAGEHGLESPQLEVVVRLLGKLFITKSEEWNNLSRQLLCRSKSLGEESNLGNHRGVRGSHGQGPEQLLQIVRQIGSTSVGGILGSIQIKIYKSYD